MRRILAVDDDPRGIDNLVWRVRNTLSHTGVAAPDNSTVQGAGYGCRLPAERPR